MPPRPRRAALDGAQPLVRRRRAAAGAGGGRRAPSRARAILPRRARRTGAGARLPRRLVEADGDEALLRGRRGRDEAGAAVRADDGEVHDRARQREQEQRPRRVGALRWCAPRARGRTASPGPARAPDARALPRAPGAGAGVRRAAVVRLASAGSRCCGRRRMCARPSSWPPRPCACAAQFASRPVSRERARVSYAAIRSRARVLIAAPCFALGFPARVITHSRARTAPRRASLCLPAPRAVKRLTRERYTHTHADLVIIRRRARPWATAARVGGTRQEAAPRRIRGIARSCNWQRSVCPRRGSSGAPSLQLPPTHAFNGQLDGDAAALILLDAPTAREAARPRRGHWLPRARPQRSMHNRARRARAPRAPPDQLEQLFPGLVVRGD